MHELWQMLSITSEFKCEGDVWRVIHDGNDNTIMARNLRTQHIAEFNPYCLVELIVDIERNDHLQLSNQIKVHIAKHGWHNTAKVLREVVFVHVGWDSDFTELDNVLRRIERNLEESTTKDVDRALRHDREANDYTADKLDIPNLPDGDPADHFS